MNILQLVEKLIKKLLMVFWMKKKQTFPAFSPRQASGE